MIQSTIQLAKAWHTMAHRYRSKKDLKDARRRYAILHDPQSKAFLVSLLDQLFRSRDAVRMMDQLKYLVQKFGIPPAFSRIERLLFWGLLQVGPLIPRVAIRLFRWQLVRDTRQLILSREDHVMGAHIRRRKAQGFQVNINLIGEDVLGDEGATARFEDYMQLLAHPDVDYVSVKISAICAHLSPLGRERSLDILTERMTALYRHAQSFTPHKFINLDMESYKDLHTTAEMFMSVLSQPEFLNLSAGIVLQAYLPDSYGLLQQLCAWSQKRISAGGVPIKLRLVKGANLEMERVSAEMNTLEMPIYASKEEVDANFKRLLHYMVAEDRMKAVMIGCGSHNVLDMAYAWQLVQAKGLEAYFVFEMLEGMSNHTALFLQENVHATLLYTPVVTPDLFYYALAYLFRRLDENTGPKNYINHDMDLPEDSASWGIVTGLFHASVALMPTLAAGPRRQQNRVQEAVALAPIAEKKFQNEPNTDFYLPQNYLWAKSLVDRWESQALPGSVMISSKEDVAACIHRAVGDASQWSGYSHAQRQGVMDNLAALLKKNRGSLIGIAAKETGKLFLESDVEISEAIDFVRYYPQSLTPFLDISGVTVGPKGVVLVISPWNFPIAIPLGGVVAALATGNRVILKPAPQSQHTAALLAQYCWDAGVPKEALQLVFSSDPEVLSALTSSAAIDHIVFTGSTETARRIQASNPHVMMSAETGGKNAMYVSDLCDDDLAIKTIVQSAFSNAGQKCSACSILLLHRSRYDEAAFLVTLKDAAKSLIVGSPWSLDSEVGPMISGMSDKVDRALLCEGGSYWLLAPVRDAEDPRYLSPGIKMNESPSSYSVTTELFAPILSVIPVDSLEEAVGIVNALPYGLTSGLASLDERAHRYWQDHVDAGNLYINRGITGAVVGRQPFGGVKASSLGSGIKAGGLNYARQFLRYTNAGTCDYETLCGRYLAAYHRYFETDTPLIQVYGESNMLRYKANNRILFRVSAADDWSCVRVVLYALQLTKNRIVVSYDPALSAAQKSFIGDIADTVYDEALSNMGARLSGYERLRSVSPLRDSVLRQQSAEASVTIIDHAPLHSGRLELLYYLNEQVVTTEYHRYGNISGWDGESRR